MPTFRSCYNSEPCIWTHCQCAVLVFLFLISLILLCQASETTQSSSLHGVCALLLFTWGLLAPTETNLVNAGHISAGQGDRQAGRDSHIRLPPQWYLGKLWFAQELLYVTGELLQTEVTWRKNPTVELLKISWEAVVVVSLDCEACCAVQVVQPTEQNKICTAVRATEQPILSTNTKKKKKKRKMHRLTSGFVGLLWRFALWKETRHHVKKIKKQTTLVF